MRIAVLMHGIVGNADKFGTGTQMDCEISHKHFVKNRRTVIFQRRKSPELPAGASDSPFFVKKE